MRTDPLSKAARTQVSTIIVAMFILVGYVALMALLTPAPHTPSAIERSIAIDKH